MSSHISRLGKTVSVSIPTDASGHVGRECPNRACLGYFKVKPGTGLTGNGIPCICPYCGHKGKQDTFWTREQIEYAKSVAIRQIREAVFKDLKQLEFNHPAPRSGFGIGMSMTVRAGSQTPIQYYREKRLETELVCEQCTLKYSIYGVFAHCPDCGVHNSTQILIKNLELAAKEVELATTLQGELATHLVGDALENAVATFDGYGRELCRVNSAHAANSAEAKTISFQNLDGACRNVNRLYRIDMSAAVTSSDWTFATRCFQKRHLLAHSMGVVDDGYVQKTGDTSIPVGRKASIDPQDVNALLDLLRTLGTSLAAAIGALPERTV